MSWTFLLPLTLYLKIVYKIRKFAQKILAILFHPFALTSSNFRDDFDNLLREENEQIAKICITRGKNL